MSYSRGIDGIPAVVNGGWWNGVVVVYGSRTVKSRDRVKQGFSTRCLDELRGGDRGGDRRVMSEVDGRMNEGADRRRKRL